MAMPNPATAYDTKLKPRFSVFVYRVACCHIIFDSHSMYSVETFLFWTVFSALRINILKCRFVFNWDVHILITYIFINFQASKPVANIFRYIHHLLLQSQGRYSPRTDSSYGKSTLLNQPLSLTAVWKTDLNFRSEN